MELHPISVSFGMPNGPEITIETGKLARQADGAVTVQCGNCILFASVVGSKEPRPGQSFFPLTVDYQEKFASAGHIPGSFFKREGRLSDYEVLISRLVDRALRPLFPEGYLCDVQVIINLISADEEIMPDALAGLAASAALAVSDIPIQEMISEVRVARIDGQYVINPSRSQLENSDMDFIVAASEKNIMMVEGESKECQEEDLIYAIQAAHEVIKQQIQAQKELREKVGAPAKREVSPLPQDESIKAQVEQIAKEKVAAIIHKATDKHERTDIFNEIKEEVIASFGEEAEEATISLAKYYYEDLLYHAMRNMILDDRRRLDGRSLDVVRPLYIEAGPLPSPHGSALFTRGETQSLSTVTLGTKQDELLVETAGTSEYEKFILHYNFPPYSTGETKPLRSPSRREVGHGNLAKRSLYQIMPKGYPYTVRIVSDILESNGSSSMATVCAGSLALMDAGVPFKKHVSGIAMGLISRSEDGAYAILTDILGDEDHLGDMDFKVTGTRDGICGVQMDIKVDGLSMNVMREALEQAHKGRMHILDAMYQTLPEHRPDLKPQTPRIEQIIVDQEFIGAIIGPGGKVIQEIQKETNTEITIEEENNKGIVKIFSNDAASNQKAKDWIKSIVAVPEVGETYEAVVKSIMPYGAFVEFLPGKQGLLHISEITWKRLENMDGVFEENMHIKVKLVGLDPKTGKYRLSRKVLMPKPEGYEEHNRDNDREGRRPRHNRHDRSNNHQDLADHNGAQNQEQKTGNSGEE